MTPNTLGSTNICKQKEIKSLGCPTPRGSVFGGGWDTIRPFQALARAVVGGVPSVLPLDSLLRTCVRACAHTPEKTAFRGGTHGTKSERRRDAPKLPASALSLSPHGWDAYGTGVGQE